MQNAASLEIQNKKVGEELQLEKSNVSSVRLLQILKSDDIRAEGEAAVVCFKAVCQSWDGSNQAAPVLVARA